jgi:hypothetical protein
MRFWSEGLGDRELVMSLSKARMERQGDITLLSGVVESPAPWEYEVKIERADWETVLKTAVTPEACGFIARRASFGMLAGMVWSIVSFVALLAWFRTMRLIAPRRADAAKPDRARTLAASPALKE